jgi:hypothetical protein
MTQDDTSIEIGGQMVRLSVIVRLSTTAALEVEGEQCYVHTIDGASISGNRDKFRRIARKVQGASGRTIQIGGEDAVERVLESLGLGSVEWIKSLENLDSGD